MVRLQYNQTFGGAQASNDRKTIDTAVRNQRSPEAKATGFSHTRGEA
jgi:hypothetical protein